MSTVANFSERDMRFEKLRRAMDQDNLDALVIAGKGHWWTGRGYFRYLTDFHLWGHDGMILFPLAGEPMLTLTSAAIAGRIAQRGWITDGKGDPDIAVEIVKAIKQKGLSQARIGVVGRKFILSVGTWEILKSELPDVSFVDAGRLFDRVRAVKSPLEIQQNRELWSLAKKAMDAFSNGLHAGKTQYELLAEPVKVVAAGGGRDTLIFFNGQPPSDTLVELKDILSYHMEISGPSGHWCELTVTWAFRDPTQLELDLMESEIAAQSEICKKARPGMRIRELAELYDQVMSSRGWKWDMDGSPHYDLHSQGMDTIEWPYFGSLDTREGEALLEEGMIFSYHPGRHVIPNTTPTGINENLLITKNGAERLSGDWNLRWNIR